MANVNFQAGLNKFYLCC